MMLHYWLESMPGVIGLACLFLLSLVAIVVMARLYGKAGLYIYGVVAIIVANIQVLRAVELPFFTHPVPLGSEIFTSLFLVGDILTECYGIKAAKRSIWLGMSGSLLFSLFLFVTISIAPLPDDSSISSPFTVAHHAMKVLFTPSLSIVAASIAAYTISLWFDVALFQTLKRLCNNRWLWLRSILSSFLGIIMDTLVFSLLAWVVLAMVPIDFDILFYSYIMGTIIMRMLMVVLSVPVFYGVRHVIQRTGLPSNAALS